MRVTFNRVFSAAHRLHDDPSKCKNIHGHNYRVKVQIEGDLTTGQTMMVPFDRVKEVIDKYDHALILYVWDPLVQLATQEVVVVTVPDAPTTENLAHEIVQDIADLVRGPAEREVTVVLQETDNIQAVATLVTSAEREEV